MPSIRRARDYPLGLDVHPTSTASIRGDRIGRTPMRRCIQCGAPNDTRKTAWGPGSGLVKISDPTIGVNGIYDEPAEFRAKSGCNFCGSKNWQKGRPTKLPDTKRMSATGWSRWRREV